MKNLYGWINYINEYCRGSFRYGVWFLLLRMWEKFFILFKFDYVDRCVCCWMMNNDFLYRFLVMYDMKYFCIIWYNFI